MGRHCNRVIRIIAIKVIRITLCSARDEQHCDFNRDLQNQGKKGSQRSNHKST